MRPASSERTPLWQYVMTGAFLSGTFPSTCISRKPRGTLIETARWPSRYSSFSRTSRRTVPDLESAARFTSSAVTSGTALRASSRISWQVYAILGLRSTLRRRAPRRRRCYSRQEAIGNHCSDGDVYLGHFIGRQSVPGKRPRFLSAVGGVTGSALTHRTCGAARFSSRAVEKIRSVPDFSALL